jgi:hypothetical protein
MNDDARDLTVAFVKTAQPHECAGLTDDEIFWNWGQAVRPFVTAVLGLVEAAVERRLP